MKTRLVLSLIAHLAVLAWAASAPQPAGPAAKGLPDGPVTAVTVDLRADRRDLPDPHAAAAPRVRKPGQASRAADARALPDTGAQEAARRPVVMLRGEEFARMVRVQGTSARAAKYVRTAPREFEALIRPAIPPAALGEDGNATVSISLPPGGGRPVVDILSELPALKTALASVRWEAAPLPARYGIASSGVTVTVSIAGERLRVGLRML